MFSRRNIRVKVMQTLYAMEAAGAQIPAGQAVNILRKNIDQSGRLFTYLIYFITEVAGYAEVDAAQRSGKYRPDSGDLNVNTRISGNEFVVSTLKNESFKKALSAYHFDELADTEVVKKIYGSLLHSPQYQRYTHATGDNRSEKTILKFIFSDLMLPNEDFIHHLEENFVNWDDDGDMMIALVSGFFQKPDTFDFNGILSGEKWDFARDLLICVHDKKEYCLELIKPRLKNWDADRIASLDMIIMQMGVCELIFFETIPPKVTINECIDLAKAYSTPQSGHFVNGILDNIHKELVTANKIHKRSFKNSTL